MKIIGYSYEADWHCIACTQKRFVSFNDPETNEHGVPENARDDEGNPVHPVFSTDELPCDLDEKDGGYSPVACGECHSVIKERGV